MTITAAHGRNGEFSTPYSATWAINISTDMELNLVCKIIFMHPDHVSKSVAVSKYFLFPCHVPPLHA
jgi:hypothetical protein